MANATYNTDTDLSNLLSSGEQVISWSSLYWSVVVGRELLISIAHLKRGRETMDM